MPQELHYLKQTPSQTAGPYVHIGLAPDKAGFDIFENNFGNILVGPKTRGEKITIEGRVLDATGTPMRDALVEIWQANSEGRYNHPVDQQPKQLDPDFRGWGRAAADFSTGIYRFETIKPGVVSGRHKRPMAPHINVWVVARGINIGVHTRMYFSDHADLNAKDPVLNLIELEARRATLVAERSQRGGETVYTFDIVFQGDKETVFFDV